MIDLVVKEAGKGFGYYWIFILVGLFERELPFFCGLRLALFSNFLLRICALRKMG